MKITQKREVTVTIELTSEEVKLFKDGIGNTSSNDRESIGMTKEQAQFLTTIYWSLPEIE